MNVLEKYLVFNKRLMKEDLQGPYAEQNKIENKADNMLTIHSLLAPSKPAARKQNGLYTCPEAAPGSHPPSVGQPGIRTYLEPGEIT